jgi:hypothetical protein
MEAHGPRGAKRTNKMIQPSLSSQLLAVYVYTSCVKLFLDAMFTGRHVGTDPYISNN